VQQSLMWDASALAFLLRMLKLQAGSRETSSSSDSAAGPATRLSIHPYDTIFTVTEIFIFVYLYR
jgi:hypothetical protein